MALRMRVRERGNPDAELPQLMNQSDKFGRVVEPFGMRFPVDPRSTWHVAADREHMVNAGRSVRTDHSP